MREHKRRVLLGAAAALYLLAGIWAPAPALADTAAASSAAPDLIIETITWSPEVPSIGDTVTFTVIIKNQGSSQADASHIAGYIDDTRQTTTDVSPIAPGDTAAKDFTWTARAGSHTAKAVADANNQVSESNEANNESSFAFSVPAPDLLIEAITWSPETPSINSQITCNVTVKNRGDSQARVSHVDLYVDGNSRGYQDVPRLEAGANVTRTFSWPAHPGSHTIKAVADALNHVTESDEANNEKTAICATATPDLIVEDITWSPANPTENATVTLTATIRNQGSGKADYSHLDWYIDNAYQTTAYVSQIAADATATETFTWTAQAGSHTAKAVTDASNRVIESDETNNEKAVALSGPAPDLIVQSITSSPSSPLISHRVIFTVSVKNQGKTEAARSLLYFYIDGAHKFQQDISLLAAGGTATATFSWTVRSASHVLKAVIDEDNTIIESDETNNEKTVTIGSSTSPTTADLMVQDITWSPENPSTEDTVTVTATIKNQGSGQAGPSHAIFYINDVCQTTAYVNQLSAGATVTKTFTWKAQAGSHTAKAVTDASNRVIESDETNNEKAVALSGPAPDLIVHDITWAPTTPTAGDAVSCTVTIKNQGDYRAIPSRVAYYLDGSPRGSHNVPEIGAGATATTVFTWTAQTDRHAVKAVADGENYVIESDEANNEKVLNLPPPDLIIEAITWSPANPTANATVTLSATIRNQGSGSAIASDVSFYIDDSLVGRADVTEIDSLAAATATLP
ncbi:CARDB domain-containing protein, partial [Chloroflexota bacterium]